MPEQSPPQTEDPRRLLLLEDERDQRRLMASILTAQGYTLKEVESLARARSALQEAPFDLVLSDWKLPDGDGLELLDLVREQHPRTAFIMVTAYGTISRAVEAIQRGADDYLTKPFERRALLLTVEKTLRARLLEDENRRLNAALDERERLVDLVGKAPSMQRVFRQVEKLAGTRATVLITGESGTGKELAARALHALSPRRKDAFVAVNCAAVPEHLIEAEFFGVERGAFTGADRTRAGTFERADGGTLFLDEVGELPLALQPKLLRALQEGRFTRVGGQHEIASDMRLIAATNRDLAAEVRAGRFREDLFYRLNVVPLSMPPLRDRREDIPRLVEHFTERAARQHGRRIERLPRRVLKRLIDHSWPGNVRELGNAVERLVLLAEGGTVSEEDLPEGLLEGRLIAREFVLPAEGLNWEEHERSCLQQALERSHGNRAQAARLLGLPYKAFLYRLEKHQIQTSEPGSATEMGKHLPK